MSTTPDKISTYPGERLVWRLQTKTDINNTKPRLQLSRPVPGSLYLTNFRIIFLPSEDDDIIRIKRHYPNFFHVPLPLVFKITSAEHGKITSFYCKDYRVLSFTVDPIETSSGRFEVFNMLAQRYAFPVYPVKNSVPNNYVASPTPFAFLSGNIIHNSTNNTNTNNNNNNNNNTEVTTERKQSERFTYDAIKEYERMGITAGSGANSTWHGKRWRVSRANESYALCTTYPKILIVPRSQTDQQLADAAPFRSRQRLPALCFLHPETGAPLLRCSQPFVGLRGKRSEADELLVSTAGVTLIVDCRPKKSAMANMAAGKGYENVSQHYSQCQLCFCDIENIHSVRKAHNGMCEMFLESESKNIYIPFDEDESKNRTPTRNRNGSNSNTSSNTSTTNTNENSWLSSLENTKWLKLVRMCLTSADQIARKLAEGGGEGVLVHCSDGWDRTAQVCSLAELLIDPYYRTIKGFAILVEKEWCSFGHQFARRTGRDRNHADDQRSPIFIQWLDSVWQLTQQFPLSFEFNDTFLSIVADALYSCRFGTFLYDCERQRTHADVYNKTYSLWDYISQQGKMVQNLNYVTTNKNSKNLKNSKNSKKRLIPKCQIRHMSKIWPYLHRWTQDMLPLEHVMELERQRIENVLDLTRERNYYRDKCLSLQAAVGESTIKDTLQKMKQMSKGEKE